MRDNVYKVFISDINDPAFDAIGSTEVPVLYDATTQQRSITLNHMQGGNVLFLDGHVEFVKYRPDLRLTISDLDLTGETFGTQIPYQNLRIPYTRLFIEWTAANTYDNQPLINVPPWCGNRLPGTPFEPRYLYYPNDPRYKDLNLLIHTP
jgi:prepilin-type processing-associated H-X9-DG protein